MTSRLNRNILLPLPALLLLERHQRLIPNDALVQVPPLFLLHGVHRENAGASDENHTSQKANRPAPARHGPAKSSPPLTLSLPLHYTIGTQVFSKIFSCSPLPALRRRIHHPSTSTAMRFAWKARRVRFATRRVLTLLRQTSNP
ncbi:hypothetical protein KC19_6G115800 [Ceratodon purpureus]|uniref:Uncharacterized protein n=1 Tax=Ceratodon purpureus TaxID=3225 RepID=A0A8T0HGK3_CERPU|nr:hypothetical protein KC19_6G115800 [Ceratodon purpureus]